MDSRVVQAFQRAAGAVQGVKTAGILDPLLVAPFSAIAAALVAPKGSGGRAGALGALVGAGLAALAQQEYEKRREAGEEVSPTDFVPLFRAVLGGLATGGALRAVQDQRRTGGVSPLSAFLAGAPAGALAWGGHPILGALMGTAAAPVLARLTAPAFAPTDPRELAARAAAMGSEPIPESVIRARAALILARMRQQEALRGLRALNASAIANPSHW